MRINNAIVGTSCATYNHRIANNSTATNPTEGAIVSENNVEGVILDLNKPSEPELHLYNGKKYALAHVEKDSINLNEVSDGRSLGDSIIDEYYPVSEINTRLHNILDGKDKALSKATLEIIGNIHTDESETTPLERIQLKELAASQAEFLAENYMTEEEADAYLKIIDDIMGFADFSKYGMELVGYTSIEKGETAVYKPVAAPEGYVPASAVYKMYMSEDVYRQYQNTIANNKNGSELEINMKPFLNNMAQYQKKAYEDLTRNLNTLNNLDNTFGIFSSMDKSSLESYKESFGNLMEEGRLCASVEERIQRFVSLLNGVE